MSIGARFSPLIASLLLISVSCNSPSGGAETKGDANTDSITQSVASETTSPSVAIAEPRPPEAVYGVLLGETSFFSDSLASEETAEKISGTTVEILAKTGTVIQPPDQDGCSAFYWYQVRTKSGKTGWVKGQDLHRNASGLSDSFGLEKNVFRQAITMGGKRYYLEGAVEMNIDLPGDAYMDCPTYMFPYFYDDEGVTYLVDFNVDQYANAPGHVRHSSEGYLMLTLSSDGGHAHILTVTTTKVDGEQFAVFSLDHTYQDGGESSQLFVRKNESGFSVGDFQFGKDQEQQQEQEKEEEGD